MAVIRDSAVGVLVTAAVGLTAAWLTRRGILPGRSLSILGPALQGLLWMGVATSMSVAYRAVPPRGGDSDRHVVPKIGACLLLALSGAYLGERLVRPLLLPVSWARLGYLGIIVPPALVVLWCALLLPRETRALYRAARDHSTGRLVIELFGLLAAAAALVSAADLALQAGGEGEIAARIKADVILLSAWATNTLILFSAHVLVFAVTARATAALLVVSPLYVACGLATLAKLKYMHSAVQPLDLLRIPEFLQLFRSFFGATTIVVIVVFLGLWIAAFGMTWRLRPCPLSRPARRSLGLLSLAALVAVGGAFFAAVPAVDALLLRVGAPEGQHREKARRNGFLLSFLSEVPAIFVTAPGNYSRAAVASALEKYSRPGPPAPGDVPPRVNLVVYLIESFMDPDDLGLHYTADPIPTIRALRRERGEGHAIVPERFGGSANTEFELLTGMTRSFLPDGSLPYRQYLRRSIPSLPGTLRASGYATVAIQADPRYYYDRERVYELLGFDTTVWVHEDAGVERPRGRWPSDASIVEAVIRVSRAGRPFFAFAFPSSTHAPYHFGTYETSQLDVLDLASPNGRQELKEYINALRVADRAVETLVDHFRRWPHPTVIVVLGDHLPPLSDKALGGFFARLSGLSETERQRMLHRVPLLVWANFDLPRAEGDVSTNAIGPYALERMGMLPPGFLSVVAEVRRRLPVLSSYAQTADGRTWRHDTLPAELRAVVDDYRLLQHDLLLGKQYALLRSASRYVVPGAESASATSSRSGHRP